MESTTVTQLPTEILVLILQGLSTTELLNKCRMISQQWNQIATSLCRKRYNSVSIQAEKFYANLELAYMTQVFSDKDNLPWSAVHIQLSCGYHGSAVNRQIANSFGNCIKRLIISVETYNYDTLIYLLQKMPNLEVLRINDRSILDGTPLQNNGVPTLKDCLPPTAVVNLSQLNNFEFTISHKPENHFLEFILTKVGSTLKRVFIVIPGLITREEDFQKMLEILRNTNVTVAMHLSYMEITQPCWRLLAQEIDLDLRNLSISFTSPSLPRGFQVLEHSVSKCRKLATLTLNINCLRTHSRGTEYRFTIPELLQLEVLKLNSRCRGKQDHHTLTLNPINPACLPKLRKVWIENNKIENDPEDFKPIFYNSSGHGFVTVTEFIGNDANDMITWSQIFPNLINLKLTNISRSTDLEHIFKCMPNLKYLSINLSAMEMDVNLALSTCFRSPVNLDGLRTMTIRDILTEERKDLNWNLSDPGAILLLLLPPLHLKISAGGLSEGCISKLRSHHLVELL